MIKNNSTVRPDPNRSTYLGMTKEDLADVWYAKYWNPKMAELPKHVTAALVKGPQASPLLPILEEVRRLTEPDYQDFETGFGITEDGVAVVAVLTKMPNVTPLMLDWWFNWHSSDSRRYKLWNPNAHLYACWNNPLICETAHQKSYIGRTSFIDEFVGSTKMSLALQFIQPSLLGFDEKMLADTEKVTVICGRVGLSEQPIDNGYLVHYIDRISEGSMMRSRFWLGGKYFALRDDPKRTLETTPRNDAMVLWQAYSLLVHCSMEMNHLATFLPKIYKESFNQSLQDTP